VRFSAAPAEKERGTQELLKLYIHERFLCRLAGSHYKEQLVLKTILRIDRHRHPRPAAVHYSVLGRSFS
jgi:hypothetical protein